MAVNTYVAQKEVTETFMMKNGKNNFGLHGLYSNISALKGLNWRWSEL